MATTGNSKDGRSKRYKAQRIEKLSNNSSVKHLLGHYGLSLTEEMSAVLCGGDQRFLLNVYDDTHEQNPQLLSPRLEYLSQDLGFANAAGYDYYKSQKNLPEDIRIQLFKFALQKGTDELNKYLRDLRPLLMERHIYFYTTPLTFVRTEVQSGQFAQEKGKRVLNALPDSVETADVLGYSREKIKELAPQVAWLIPQLVVYRKVKATDELIRHLDGWLQFLSPQKNEVMHTKFLKHAPHIVSAEVTQLLMRDWSEDQ